MSDLYMFSKSGSVVEKVRENEPAMWTVRRIDTGKEMLVPECGLIPLHQIMVCPYCGNTLSEERNACCGEAGHGELTWVTNDANQIEVSVPGRNQS